MACIVGILVAIAIIIIVVSLVMSLHARKKEMETSKENIYSMLVHSSSPISTCHTYVTVKMNTIA